MDLETILGITGFGIAVVLTPVYLVLLAKGVRSISDLRDMFARRPRTRDGAE